jgi:cytochrome P450
VGALLVDEAGSVASRFASSGTTSSTLAFLVCSVTADPTVYNNLKAELRETFPGGPNVLNTLPEIHKIQQLPYLNAVINESLRKYPAIPGSIPQMTISSDLKVRDLKLPRSVSVSRIVLKIRNWKSSIGINILQAIVSTQNHSIHMKPDYFPSPHRFILNDFSGTA